MLQRITLEHFKCFERLKLPLAPLTLLTGLNASGKSTTIQALAMLHQTITEHPNSPGLVLNGKDVTLGSADELVDKVTGRDTFAIGLEHADGSVTWHMNVKPDPDAKVKADLMIAPFTNLEWRHTDGRSGETHSDSKALHPVRLSVAGTLETEEILAPLLTTLRTLTYISADRIGPRETYPASSSAQQDGVGARGEFTPWFIDYY